MRTDAALLALALAASSSLHCGSEVALPSGGGGTGGEPLAVGGQPDPDPCEDVDISNCCETEGCELAFRSKYLDEPVCVSEDRWCYHGSKERACPAGYECVAFSSQCFTPCEFSGELNVCSHGYCFWVEP